MCVYVSACLTTRGIVLCSVLAIRDNIMQYSLLIYTADGHKQQKYQAYKHCLGIKSMVFSPSGQFLALGSYDEQARIVNHLTWTCIAAYKPPRRVDGDATVSVVGLGRVGRGAVHGW